MKRTIGFVFALSASAAIGSFSASAGQDRQSPVKVLKQASSAVAVTRVPTPMPKITFVGDQGRAAAKDKVEAAKLCGLRCPEADTPK